MRFKILLALVFAYLIVPKGLTAEAVDDIRLNLWEGIAYPPALSQVRTAQQLLRKDKHLTVPATGFFGEKTFDAVKSYQRDHGLFETGIIGSLTRRLMNREIAADKKISSSPLFAVSGSFPGINYSTDKLLDVPLIEQQYPLSCEAANLQMALLYKGIVESQDELIYLIGFSSPLVKYHDKKGDLIWGNPNLGFVGDIRGWMYTSEGGMAAATGWGVNNGPVARVADAFRPGSFSKSGESVADIIKEIEAGNPVIVWHYSSLRSDRINIKSYKTEDGKLIPFIPTHVKLVVGFKRNGDELKFLINDPEYGRVEMDSDVFEWLWTAYNRDMVVIK